jgi:hypothetical protein
VFYLSPFCFTLFAHRFFPPSHPFVLTLFAPRLFSLTVLFDGTVFFYATVFSPTVGFDILSPLCVMWPRGAAVDVEETEEEYADGCFRTEFLKIRTRGFSETRSENQT